MALSHDGAMPIGYTRTGRAVWPISGGAGEGEGAGEGGGKGDEIDPVAAKAAMDVVAKMKEAGVEDPSTVLDLVGKLRDFEKGTKLPKAIEKELNDLRAKVKDAEGVSKSESEKMAEQLKELQAKLDETSSKGSARVAKAAIKASAASAGATYPDDIPKLIEPADVEFDDDGEPTNVDKLVAGLKKTRPALFAERKAGSGDGGPRGGPPAGKGGMEDLLRAAAGH